MPLHHPGSHVSWASRWRKPEPYPASIGPRCVCSISSRGARLTLACPARTRGGKVIVVSEAAKARLNAGRGRRPCFQDDVQGQRQNPIWLLNAFEFSGTGSRAASTHCGISPRAQTNSAAVVSRGAIGHRRVAEMRANDGRAIENRAGQTGTGKIRAKEIRIGQAGLGTVAIRANLRFGNC